MTTYQSTSSLPPANPLVDDLFVKTSASTGLRLYKQEQRFAGYLPAVLWCVAHAEYIDDDAAEEPKVMVSQTEYFRADQYSLAYEALHIRFHSQHPEAATNLGEPLDSLLTMTETTRQAKERSEATEAALRRGFHRPNVEHLAPLPPNSNPFHYDLSSMGTTLLHGWMVMHDGFAREEYPKTFTRLDLVNTRTGQRFRINLVPPTKYTRRGFSRLESPEDWCVFGKASDGTRGVLEWCTDEKDARAKFLEMLEFQNDFKELRCMKFNDPDSQVLEWKSYGED